MVDTSEVDSEIRRETFRFLDELRSIHGNALPRSLLERGFEFRVFAEVSG